ncbi:hypothetical protein [Streptomyces sp. HB132]|uniref:hypothetical protein n=1 Tax=Streptomyces sp. HB132 TaxID=767388 RepID=UPI0019616855|nr:hypothetical protein [Streptomyces sp. HB132]MBM7439379.1 hypothetical protein [Streptomyces sp. HB132]
MFTGIDDVDWASMGHAYGDASDVPDLLRGLASSDAGEREIALDAMHGAVHHQGDVYDSTVACIPFLFELVGTVGLPGRGEIVDLLRSVEGDGRDPEEMDFWSDDDDEYAAWAGMLAEAESQVRARSGALLELLDDADEELRRALPGALVQLHNEPETVLAALSLRLAGERDPNVLRALVAALGELGVRRPECTERAGETLAGLLPRDTRPGNTGLQLSALVQLVRCAPGRLPDRSVEIATDVMRNARDAQEDAGHGNTGPVLQTPTMISYLRGLKASRRATAKAPWATELLADLHRALDDRAAERFALLEDQLRSPDWGQRRDAIDMAGLLLTGWRGPHGEPVRLLGEQLLEADHRIIRWAASELVRLYAIGGPAADALAERVSAVPDFPPQARWNETSYGAVLSALAAQGDARAVPGLLEVLRFGHVPEDLGDWIDRMDRSVGATLATVLDERLSALDPVDRRSWRAEYLLNAAVAAGSAEATDTVLRILRTPEDRPVPARGAALRALARLGPATARECLPELRSLARNGSSQHNLDAAAALWSVGGEEEAVLLALRTALAAEDWSPLCDALRVVTGMGAGAAVLLPELRALAASPERNTGWVAGDLAAALWEAGRDVEESLPVLLHAWSAHIDNRPGVAGVWAGMGSAAAPAVPVLREEIAATRRHNNTGGEGRMRYRCADDELLLQHARAVLEACDG